MKNLTNEVWKPFSQADWDENEHIFVSNYGRVKKLLPNGDYKQLKFYKAGGYPMFWYRKKTGKTSAMYVHRTVATLFIPKKENQSFVLHLDYDKSYNDVQNLKWASRKEVTAHNMKNPNVIAGKINKRTNYKLDEAKVRILKRKIFDPNRRTRLKMIARQFGISEMQLYRIKTGENWGHVTDY